MAYFERPLRETERTLQRLRIADTNLSDSWRDATGRRFLKDSLHPVLDRYSQMLTALKALEDLGRQR